MIGITCGEEMKEREASKRDAYEQLGYQALGTA